MPDKTLPPLDPPRNLPELLPHDALRQLLLSALTQLMESEVSALCAASHGIRSDDRQEDGRVLSKAVLIATGVSELGEREIVGVTVASGEMEPCWSDFLRSLQMRGLTKVKLVISDAHSGLRRAIQTTLVGATWQRCMVHFLRNVLVLVPKAHQRLTASLFRMAFDQTNRKDAREFYGRALEMLRNKFPKAAQCAEEAEEDGMAYLSFPQTHWKQVHSTNPLERLNKEIRRRTDVVGIFPNDASLLRLVAMLLVEQQEEWSVGRRYLSLKSMQELKENAAEPEMQLVALAKSHTDAAEAM